MRIAVVGTGYVGLTTAVSLAMHGHHVTGIDVDTAKVEKLQAGITPIYEPGLDQQLIQMLKEGRLQFAPSADGCAEETDIYYLCVGTPSQADGTANLRYLFQAADSLRRYLGRGTRAQALVIKSTVPVGTGDKVAEMFHQPRVHVVSNPEFLREGTALQDALKPSRIVIGAASEEAVELMNQLYADMAAPRVYTTRTNAEMIKYASNAFLAAKISFMNELARLCAKTGTDISMVALGMGLDTRIGSEFLRAGLGYGGSCFPKDTDALLHLGREHGVELTILEQVRKVNQTQADWFVAEMKRKLKSLTGKRIGLLGLSFKPDTDDIREAPSLALLSRLRQEGADVVAYDPVAIPFVQAQFPDVTYVNRPMDAFVQADAAVLVTEWEACTRLDWPEIRSVMRFPCLFDGRNAWPTDIVKQLGFAYTGVGRR